MITLSYGTSRPFDAAARLRAALGRRPAGASGGRTGRQGEGRRPLRGPEQLRLERDLSGPYRGERPFTAERSC